MRLFPLILVIGFLNFGTTYIVREDGQEVGRWVESDGEEITRYIDNDRSSNHARYYGNETDSEWVAKQKIAEIESERQLQELIERANAPLEGALTNQ